jgi:hypothetical protein
MSGSRTAGSAMGLAKLELKKICTEHKNVEFITLIFLKIANVRLFRLRG